MSSTGKKRKNTNNLTTTGTGKNTPMLGVPTQIIKTTREAGNQTLEEESESFQYQKTLDLRALLNKINSAIIKENQMMREDTNQLNEIITEKVFQISDLLKINKDYVSQLKDIKETINSKMTMGDKYLYKMEKLKKKEAELKKDLKVIDKEILIAGKNQEIAKNDYNYMKNLEAKIDPELQNSLLEKLQALQRQRKQLQYEIKELKKIIKEHKLCKKEKENLISTLNIITNSYQFEIKKENMFDSNIADLEEKKEKAKEENDRYKENIQKMNGNCRSISYCTNLRKNVIDRMSKINSERNVISDRAKLHVNNLCNKLEEQYIKSSGNIVNMDNNNYQNTPKYLFTQNEQVQLATIIPPSYLNKFKERFGKVENERYNLVDKIKINKQSSPIKSLKININYNELKKKEQKILRIDLNSKVIKANTHVNKLKSDLNRIMNEINSWNKMLKMKTIQNLQFNKYINSITKNKGDSESKIKIKDKDKTESDLEEENDMNFAYNME